MRGFAAKYKNLMRAVREAHESRQLSHGHDFDHAIAVANLAGEFCEVPAFADLARIAGLCHNADRMIALDLGNPCQEIADDDIEVLIRSLLQGIELSIGDVATVIQAVLNHGKPNSADDGPVTIALKDADRVVNVRLDVLIRSGQFKPELPVLHPGLLLKDTRGKYSDRYSVLGMLLDCLEWGNLEDERFCVRTSRAKTMIIPRVHELRELLRSIVRQREEEGLVLYPFTYPTIS